MYWLHSLPDVCEAAGLDTDVWPGWETRSRSSGGYTEVWAVFCHHTASDTSPSSDMSYMWDSTSGDQPIGAIYLARDGRVTVGAAGATNTQGKGGPWALSRGTIPKDSGNSYGIAIEAANNGTGEAWPTVQQVAYTTLCAALIDAYGLEASDILSHREWCEPSCPGRKIDPAGPSAYATGTASWNMDAFRDDVVASFYEPDTEPEDDEMTDDDVKRIANAVWRMQINTATGPANCASVLGWTYAAVQDDDAVKAAPQALPESS